jgi:hypothetical protein
VIPVEKLPEGVLIPVLTPDDDVRLRSIHHLFTLFDEERRELFTGSAGFPFGTETGTVDSKGFRELYV